jgi:hypothetical protein
VVQAEPSVSEVSGNGRTARGTFAPGNKLAKGYPHARRANRLRAELYRVVTVEEFREIVRAMVKEAKNGDIAAAREIIERLLGKPESADTMARIEELETTLRDALATMNAPRAVPAQAARVSA